MRTSTLTDRPSHDARNAFFCAALVTAAFLVVNPFAEMPFNDDWTYAFTLRRLLETGHFIYNGWSTCVILTHIWWGAMFARVFGFSFVVLRFSTLPFAAGSALFCYLLARRANLQPAGAIFASLGLSLSPLFLPMATSFMTDVPGLCYCLICFYAFVRAGQSASIRSWILWLGAGILSGIIGGMNRQTSWLPPLLIIPYLILLRRSQPRFIAAAAVGWLLVLVDVVLTLRWFNRQPWIYLTPPILESLRQGLQHWHISITNLLLFTFATVSFVLPTALPFDVEFIARLWRGRKTQQAAVTAAVVLILSVAMSLNPRLGIGPWLANIVTVNGVIANLELSGRPPIVLPLAVRGFLSALVLATCYFLVSRSVEFALSPRASLSKLRQFFSTPEPRPILAIFAIVYFALMIVRSAQDLIYDRYCLPLIPCLAIPLLRGRRLAIAWPLLAIYAAYAIASTQDNLALAAARRAAIQRLESHGVPRIQIAAGFEYDLYTQLEEVGHVNRYGITNPPHAFNALQGYAPALKCLYRLEWSPAADTIPSPFGVVEYVSWLAPFHRVIHIDQFRNPWWLSPSRPKDIPDPTSYETEYGD
jgi:4-amino-4-deoxy-L-arabinose transferase-like glycosyltransferase